MRCRLHQVLVSLLFLLAFQSGAQGLAQLGPSSLRAIEVNSAEFRRADGEPWQTVALPDTWLQRGLRASGSADYRIRFTLEAVPDVPLALGIERLSATRRIALNGLVISSTAVGERMVRKGQPEQALVQLPGYLLKPGENVLDIEVRHGDRGGLSAARIGLEDFLQAPHDRRLLWTVMLPQALNLAAAALALPGLWLVVRTTWKSGGWTMMGLCVFVTAVFGALAHDYAYQQGHLSVEHIYWLPFVMPLALASSAVVLVRRLVDALAQTEQSKLLLEARVDERTRELVSANAAKTRFLAAASHDLRQPLVTIGLLVSLAREQVASGPVRTLMDKTDEAVAAMEDLVKGLLDISRFDSGQVQPQFGPVNLQRLFAAIESHEGSAAREKGLSLRFRPTQAAVRSDPVLLEQILRNLVGNAIRYTERGGVVVAARHRGTRVELQVWDTGVGIASEHHDAVFEEFMQVGNTERDRGKGLGLGLAIVQRCVRLLDHRLHLRSRPGRGTCMSIELPVAEPGPVEVTQVPVVSEGALDGYRLLLVEDDASVRLALTERLLGWGAEVRAFGSLGDLRQAIAERPAGEAAPDLLVSDYRLPDGTGLEAMAEARSRWPGMAALLVTGDTTPQELARLAESGVSVLHKPFRAELLLARLQLISGRTESPSATG